jgi:hypothetical protein
MSLQRITAAQIYRNEWFRKGYTPTFDKDVSVNLDDIDAVFSESTVREYLCGMCVACLIMLCK